MRSRLLAALAGATLVASGCTGEISGLASSGPGSGASNGNAGSSSGPENVAPDCTEESPSPRLLRQLTRSEYRRTLSDLLWLSDPDITAIPPDREVRGFSNNASAAFVDEQRMDAFATAAAALTARALKESYAALVPCTTEDSACAAQFVAAVGRRAFRRPLSEPEKARYLALFDAGITGGDFRKGVELTLRSLLISPSFLFRSELGRDDGAGHFELTPYEIASALSYSFWGSLPDAALLSAAESGALANKSEIEAQARRLLSDERGRATIAQFFYEWLESPRAYVATKDVGSFPKLASQETVDTIRGAMREEQDRFVSHVVFDSSKKFGELFDATYTFANGALADYYGLPAAGLGAATQKVELGAGSQRGGLLTLGMFLFGHARTTASSPTQRGHMIRANLLCEDIPPPPPDVDTAVTPATPGRTTREQILALTATGTCPSCHTLQDPIGFGLEAFDGAGVTRSQDNGVPIDATGVINGIVGPGGEKLEFDGARQLSRLVGQNPKARSCFTTNYYRFARGFDAKGVDTCAVNKLAKEFTASDLELPELFVRLALQASFTTRRSAEVLSQ